MFIAIPQFHLFYSEEHYNNDGLECIRFLNEIISDFDEVDRDDIQDGCLYSLPSYLTVLLCLDPQ